MSDSRNERLTGRWMWMGLGLLALHALGLATLGETTAGSAASNLLQFLIVLLTAVAFLSVGLSSQGIVRLTCLFTASSFAFWSLGQLFFTVYLDVLHMKYPAFSLGDIFFFAYYLPLTAIFVLPWSESRDRGIDWLRLLDFTQAVIAVSSVYFFFLVYAPLGSATRGEVLVQILSVYSILDILFAIGFLALTIASRHRPVFHVLAVLTAYLFVYAIGSGLYSFALLRWQVPGSGSWFDLGYSVPCTFAIVGISAWRPAPAAGAREAETTHPAWSYLYMLLPSAVVVVLVLLFVEQAPRFSLLILSMSFIAYVTRLTLTQVREQRGEKHRRLLEAQLLQAQKMEAVGRLAGGVAHDFNNLLTVIHGYTEMALGEMGGDASSRAPLDEVKKAAERATVLTRQLLSFSRKEPAQEQPIALNALISDLQRMLERLIEKNIQLVFQLASEPRPFIADRSRIEQVVLNLIVNARDAMPNGGRLTITTANVELDEAKARDYLGTEPGTYVMVSVADTGSGMSDEVKAHIFEPFFTTKAAEKGTGLGLSTVYGIVKQYKGYITVDTAPGRGTEFAVYFPTD